MKVRTSILEKIVGFDIGESSVKLVYFAGADLKKAVTAELPDNMVSGSRILSMDAMADFLRQMAKSNGIPLTHAALVFVTLLLHYDISLQALEGWCVASILLVCSFADLEGYIIPDRFIAVGVVLFIITLFFAPQPLRRALDGAIGGLAVAGCVLLLVLGMEKLLGREAMGGGDIKLLFLTGLFLGWKRNLLCLVAACVIGIVWGLLQKKRDGGEAIPWGPSIALGAWLTALCGQQIIDWYLGLL